MYRYQVSVLATKRVPSVVAWLTLGFMTFKHINTSETHHLAPTALTASSVVHCLVRDPRLQHPPISKQ